MNIKSIILGIVVSLSTFMIISTITNTYANGYQKPYYTKPLLKSTLQKYQTLTDPEAAKIAKDCRIIYLKRIKRAQKNLNDYAKAKNLPEKERIEAHNMIKNMEGLMYINCIIIAAQKYGYVNFNSGIWI